MPTDGFYNNAVKKTKRITTHKGFEIEAAERHPLMVMDESGMPFWKRSDQIEAGDRVAIGCGMERWGDVDPLDGLVEHMAIWSKQFEGKQGPKPKVLVLK